jgi:hypothetical protein
MADQATSTATQVAATQKNTAAQGLSAVSSAVTQVGDQLRNNDQTAPIAHYVDMVGGQIQHAANYLEHHNVRQIIGHAQGFARREPALFLGGAFALGLLAARFIKSSPPQNQPSSGQHQRNTWQPSARGGYGVFGGQYGAPYRPILSRPLCTARAICTARRPASR